MVKNSLVKKEETISTYFMKDMVRKKVTEMVGSTNAQKFMTSIIFAVGANPTLQECDYGSIVSAALLGETLKLSPSPQLGQYFMVPYKCKVGKDEKGQNVYVKKAQFQLGYKGYIQLMKRSGQYERVNVVAIKEGELIKINPLTEDIEVKIIADEEEREKTPTAGYYAMFKEKTGFMKQIYWSKKRMLIHADKYSQAFSKEAYEKLQQGKIPEQDLWRYSSFWYKNFDEMAYKTMLRQLISKWATLSIDTQDMQDAYVKDMAIINDDGSYNYIDNKDMQYLEENTENNIENEKIEEKEEKTTNNTIETEKVVENDFETNDEDVINNFFN